MTDENIYSTAGALSLARYTDVLKQDQKNPTTEFPQVISPVQKKAKTMPSFSPNRGQTQASSGNAKALRRETLSESPGYRRQDS